jgi:hypothetical protein
MASTPSGTNGGCCENNIVVVILPKLEMQIQPFRHGVSS